MRVLYRVLYIVARVLTFFGHPIFRVEGRENIPEGKAVICGNHSSFTDPLWVIFAIKPKKMFRVIAKKELEHAFFIGWVMRKFNIIFVRRGEHDTQAYDACVDALRGGDKMLVFMEGTRCRNNQHLPAKTGAVRMALESDSPILPVYITWRKTLFCPIKVIIGKPFPVTGCKLGDSHAQLQAVSEEILHGIYQMGGEEYANTIGQNSGVLLRS